MLPLVPLPLVIGITGHRDLREADRPALAKEVRRVFEELRETYRSTPLVVLSALAEGADRLVAQVALDTPGVKLIVPLPMPRALYEADFTAPDSLKEFSSLLASAERWFELPLLEGADEASVRAGGETRDRQYAALGEYLAENSQILLALWDGVESKRLGGTAQTVSFKLHGSGTYIPRQRSSLDPVETGPVHQIVTPRASNPQLNGKPFTRTPLYPPEYKSHKAAKKAYDKMYARTEGFNRDALGMTLARAAQREVSSAELLPRNEATRLPHELQAVRETFGLADTLALDFQRRTYRALLEIFSGVLLAAVLFTVYAHFGQPLLVLVIYLVALGVVHMVWFVAKWLDYQNKFQDYRTLAEGLRVQFFWGLSDIRRSVAMTYLRKQRSELEWIRNGLRVVSLWLDGLAPPVERLEGPEGAQQLRLVLRYWIEAQSDYFTRAARRDDMFHSRLLKWATRLVRVGVIVAAGLLVFQLMVSMKWLHENPSVKAVAITVTTLAMVAAALAHNYAEKRALAEHAKHYARMSGIFANAKAPLADFINKEDYEGAKELLRELGAEALQESGDWVILHRERPLDVPHEGVTPPAILKTLK
jgi:hypothetical protein